MRQPVKESQKHKARGVSMPPDMAKAAAAKASRLNMGFSEYIQKLIDNDLQENVIAKILAEQAVNAR